MVGRVEVLFQSAYGHRRWRWQWFDGGGVADRTPSCREDRTGSREELYDGEAGNTAMPWV